MRVQTGGAQAGRPDTRWRGAEPGLVCGTGGEAWAVLDGTCGREARWRQTWNSGTFNEELMAIQLQRLFLSQARVLGERQVTGQAWPRPRTTHTTTEGTRNPTCKGQSLTGSTATFLRSLRCAEKHKDPKKVQATRCRGRRRPWEASGR